MTYFGQVLEELLIQRGWNQIHLSQRTCPRVTQGMISNYKYGRRKPKRETISAIAKALVSHIDNAFESHSEYKRVESQLFDIAGFKSEYDRQCEQQLFIQIIKSVGYEAEDFSDTDMEQLRHRVRLVVESIAAQKRAC